jgi:butirosin biosynthesis protein H-like/uncharacterized protein DUF4872
MASEMVGAYPHRRAGHCGSGAFRDLLEYHGLSYFDEPMSEGMVFGLSGALGFFYFEADPFELPVYVLGRTADLETALCEQLHIDLDRRQTEDPQEGWAVLRAALDAGRPTMVWADIKHLDYLNVRLHNTMHDVVVVGYDERRRVAYIADNDRDAIQACSLDSLARARHSSAFPGPNRHMTWLMEFPRALPEPRAAVTEAIHRSVENMAHPLPASGGLHTGMTGLEGVRRFVDSFEHWPERFKERLPVALQALGVFIAKAGTGGAMFRSLQAEFLSGSARLLEDARLLAAAQVYDELAAHWRSLAEVARAEDTRAAVGAAAPLVREIAALEHKGVGAMQSWSDAAVERR